MELWKDIPNYEGFYQASDLGRIRSLDHVRKNGTNEYIQKGKILKFNKNNSEYYRVRLSKNGVVKTYRVNRLIALTFINNPLNKKTVNHKDGNKLNNKVSNLEWVTAKENIQHAVKNKRFENMAIINSEKMKKSKLYLNGYPLANEVTKKKVAKYDKKNNLLNVYESISDASRNTGITITSISYACNNKRKTGGGFIWHFV